MKQNVIRLLRRAACDQSGQALVLMSFMLLGFIGLVGFVVDVGDVYYSYQELQASTNAAAMAGAAGLSTSGSQALSNAAAYSSQSGDKNQFGNLNITGYNAQLGCVTAAVGASVPCVTTGSGTQTANAIQVSQTATVRTYFMAVLGTPSVTLTATSSALMRGAGGVPSNIVIMVDTTGSMNDADKNCTLADVSKFGGGSGRDNTSSGSTPTRVGCALNGVQQFLSEIYACASGGCGGTVSGDSSNYTNAVDKVAMFEFPEAENSTQAAYAYSCGNTIPATVPYTYPTAGASSYSGLSNITGSAGDYQITPFMSNYQTVNSSGDSTSTLNTASGSDVALSAGAETGCGMTSISARGVSGGPGRGTYYAGAIYAAQAALTAEQASEAEDGATFQNVLIIVSDGAATASSSDMTSTGLNANGVGIYPSNYNECAQAVAAAQYATSLGTKVFSVAYGSPDTGCTTDTKSGGKTSPCQTTAEMASSPATFYSDYNQSGSNSDCTSSNTISDLVGIFTNIVGQLTDARLIPNSAWPSS